MHFNLISDLNPDLQLNLQDRGLHYGDGLFETMLLSNGEIIYWREHYQRLSQSARKLFINCPSQDWFEHELKPYVALNKRLLIKIILTRGCGGRGLQLPVDLSSNVYLLKYETVRSAPAPIKALFSEVILSSNDNLAGLKHLNRLDYVLATHQLQQRAEFNEALLSNSSGFLVESVINNLFFVTQDTLCTPSLERSGVNGIMRQLILKEMKQCGKKVIIGSFVKEELLESDECFLCNSVQGISPITQIEDRLFSTGPITKQLQQEFHGH